jgi:hypothetical protein
MSSYTLDDLFYFPIPNLEKTICVLSEIRSGARNCWFLVYSLSQLRRSTLETLRKCLRLCNERALLNVLVLYTSFTSNQLLLALIGIPLSMTLAEAIVPHT